MKRKTVTASMMAALGGLCLATGAAAQAPSQILKSDKIAPFADPAAIPLTKAKPTVPENWDRFGGNSRIVRNVTAATLTPVLPDPAKATGAAVIVAPGGGFFMLSIDNEGYDVARWLADHGVAAFVLKYRVTPTPVDPAAFLAEAKIRTPRSDAMEIPGLANAVEDARAAIRLVRARAGEWGIDASRVGFAGFSAGAITTLSVALEGPADARPDFIAPIYGPVGARKIPADMPPTFAAISYDDMPMLIGDLGLPNSYRTAGRPLEFHLYESGGHGYGMRKQEKTSDLWIEQFYAWMKSRGLLKGK